jgi:hypothetical protein
MWAGRAGDSSMDGRTPMPGRLSGGRLIGPPADFIDQMHNNCGNPLVIGCKFGANSVH